MTQEDYIQEAFFKLCVMSEGLYPELKLIYAIPNGGKRHIVTAVTMKRTGARKGVLDVHLPVARHEFIGLWIEFKSPGKKMTKEQAEFGRALQAEGHDVMVFSDPEAAFKTVTAYLRH